MKMETRTRSPPASRERHGNANRMETTGLLGPGQQRRGGGHEGAGAQRSRVPTRPVGADLSWKDGREGPGETPSGLRQWNSGRGGAAARLRHSGNIREADGV